MCAGDACTDDKEAELQIVVVCLCTEGINIVSFRDAIGQAHRAQHHRMRCSRIQ